MMRYVLVGFNVLVYVSLARQIDARIKAASVRETPSHSIGQLRFMNAATWLIACIEVSRVMWNLFTPR